MLSAARAVICRTARAATSRMHRGGGDRFETRRALFPDAREIARRACACPQEDSARAQQRKGGGMASGMQAPASIETSPPPSSSRDVTESALLHEAKLMDSMIARKKRTLARSDPPSYILALGIEDESLAAWFSARGLGHVMVEAALKLQTAWRERPSAGVAAKLRLEQQRLGARRKLRADLRRIQDSREDVRAEALAFFESVAPQITRQIAKLRRTIANDSYLQDRDASVAAASSGSAVVKPKGLPRDQKTLSVVQDMQAELIEHESSLFKLQEALLMCFYGRKRGARFAVKMRLDAADMTRRLIKSATQLPTDLSDFKVTLGKAGVSDAGSKAKLRVMERRRLLVAAVRAKKPETPMEQWRAERDDNKSIEACRLAIQRTRRLLARFAGGPVNEYDAELARFRKGHFDAPDNKPERSTRRSRKESERGGGDVSGGDALDRALNTWLPSDFGAKLGLEEAAEESPNSPDQGLAPYWASTPRTLSRQRRRLGSYGSDASLTAVQTGPPPPTTVLWAVSPARHDRADQGAGFKIGSPASLVHVTRPAPRTTLATSASLPSLDPHCHDVLLSLGTTQRPWTGTKGSNPYIEGTAKSHEPLGMRLAYGHFDETGVATPIGRRVAPRRPSTPDWRLPELPMVPMPCRATV